MDNMPTQEAITPKTETKENIKSDSTISVEGKGEKQNASSARDKDRRRTVQRSAVKPPTVVKTSKAEEIQQTTERNSQISRPNAMQPDKNTTK